jgi:hypothetical protein
MKKELTWKQRNSKAVTAKIRIQVDSKGFSDFVIVRCSKVYSELHYFPFIQLLKSVNLQSLDTLVSFYVVSLFNNVAINEAVQVIRNKLLNNDTLAERSLLQVDTIMELLEVCLRTTYFQTGYKFFP